MMPSITLSAPPKLNLFLHITGRRDDGYHNLQTLFQLLDGGDLLTFTATNSDAIRLSPQIEGVPEEDNLIVRAARILQEKTGSKLGCEIVVDKKLPYGCRPRRWQQQCGDHTFGPESPMGTGFTPCRTG